MAATVIDSLIVTLGLDPKDFNKGQKEAGAAFLKMRQQAQKDAKAVEDAATGMATGISRVTVRVLELGTAFLGLRGLERHLTALTSQDVQLTRFSQTVGIAARSIAELEMATQRMGGTKAGADTSIQSMAGIVGNFQQGRGLPAALTQLLARTGTRVDLSHLTTGSLMTAVATALQREAKVNPVLAANYASQLGIDPIFALMAEQHGAGLMGYAGSLGGLAPSQQALEATQKIVAAYMTIRQQVDAIFQKIIADAGPAVAQGLQQLSQFLDRHGPQLERVLGQDIKEFISALENANWKEIDSDINSVAAGAQAVASALGGWGPALRDVAGAWLLLKGVGFLNGLGGGKGSGSGGAWGWGKLFMGAENIWHLFNLDSRLHQMTPEQRKAYQQQNSGAIGNFIFKNFPFVKRMYDYTRSFGPKDMSSRAQESYNFWISKGLSPAAAWAMVGNEQGESKFDWTQRGDNGTAGGAFQWHQNRRDDILRGTGIDVWNPHTTHAQQLQAAYWEMTQGSDKGARAAWHGLKNARTMAAGEKAAVGLFERPRYPVADMWKRLGYAQSWSTKLATSSALTGPAGNVSITGPITVQTQATDAAGIARDMHGALASKVRAAKSNTGLQQ